MIKINMQYFGGNGASSGKSGGGAGGGKRAKENGVDFGAKQLELQNLVTNSTGNYKDNEKIEALLDSLPIGTVIDTQHNFGVVKIANTGYKQWDSLQNPDPFYANSSSWVASRLNSPTGLAKAYTKDLRVRKK